MARLGSAVLGIGSRRFSNAALVAMLLNGFPEPTREYAFLGPLRRWRFDLAWPDRSVAVEFEGGTWTHGRHVRGTGYDEDCRKYNAAAVHGWTVLRFTYTMLRREMLACRDILGEALGE